MLTCETHISPFADNIVNITKPRRQTDNTLIDSSAAVLLCKLILSNWNPAQWPHGKSNRIAAGYVSWQDFILLARTVAWQLGSAANNSSISPMNTEKNENYRMHHVKLIFHSKRVKVLDVQIWVSAFNCIYIVR